MHYLLIGLGIIASFALLFWLDRYYKDGDDDNNLSC